MQFTRTRFFQERQLRQISTKVSFKYKTNINKILEISVPQARGLLLMAVPSSIPGFGRLIYVVD